VRALSEGGALAVSVGLESASPRVLAAMGKGLSLETMGSAIERLAEAGIAVEVMAFTGFPTETGPEALQTIEFLRRMAPSIALFMCGEFALTRGSAVARHPSRFDIRELWSVEGDEMGLGLFHEPARPWKSAAEERRVDRALDGVASRWRLSHYPWAGSLSTAHTLLWYARCGPAVFRELADSEAAWPRVARGRLPGRTRYSTAHLERTAPGREQVLWHTLTHELRQVSRTLYEQLADELPRARPTRARPRSHRPPHA
jgi:hypothetical protein